MDIIESWSKFNIFSWDFFLLLQVTFEGVVGSSVFSDIAIDDVKFLENTVCEKTAETLGRILLFCNLFRLLKFVVI